MKTCKACGSEKDLSEFYVRARNAGGYSHVCKVCDRARLYKQRHTRDARKLSASENFLPQGRTEMVDRGDGVTLVRFGFGFKPGKAQTHGAQSGYSSALANTRDAPG